MREKMEKKTKIIAFYLPQFHVIPENDKWWGEGFTEWTNVKRGKSFYRGHYQPREPLHDDYYDLSDLKVLEKHTRMAQKAGIFGFCFYHYYFRGRTLLEKPIEQYRSRSKEAFPYCLIWANQSWERTWYRADSKNSVLLQQSYGGKEDWKKQFYYLLNFFKDERYIKVNNKPVYIIYIPQDIRCRRAMFHLWNNMAKEYGFDGIYLIAMKTTFGMDQKTELYDGYMDFEPLFTIREDRSWRKWVQKRKQYMRKKGFVGKVAVDNEYTYRYLSNKAIRRFQKSDKKIYAGVFVGWDNTARKDEDGIIVHGSTPRNFARVVSRGLYLSERKNKEFLFINAWNEWSEGAYLEPDKRYGYAYLELLKKVVQIYQQGKNKYYG